ncbi:MAG: hypothetical protein ACI936_001348 [Paraglaciecola sp.]|jgi:hypothetical protein
MLGVWLSLEVAFHEKPISRRVNQIRNKELRQLKARGLHDLNMVLSIEQFYAEHMSAFKGDGITSNKSSLALMAKHAGMDPKK